MSESPSQTQVITSLSAVSSANADTTGDGHSEPNPKRQKIASESNSNINLTSRRIICQFRDPEGNLSGPEVDLPLLSDKDALKTLLRSLLKAEAEANGETSQEVIEEKTNGEFSFEISNNNGNGSDDIAEDSEVLAKSSTVEQSGSVEMVSTTLLSAFEKLSKASSTNSNSTISSDKNNNIISSESTLFITYYPLSIFKVRPVTRCSSTLEGHSEAVLCSRFSPDCRLLATGSGDNTVRIWDLSMEAPLKTLRGHGNWVLTCEWSPDNSGLLATAGMDKKIIIWDLSSTAIAKDSSKPNENSHIATKTAIKRNKKNTKSGKSSTTIGTTSSLKKFELALRNNGHSRPITSLCWQPLHCVPNGNKNGVSPLHPKLASCSQDHTIKVWDITTGTCVLTLGGHTAPVMQIKWSGENHQTTGGIIYSAGRDRIIRCWNPQTGAMLRQLKGHGHWINSLALNTDYVLRTGHCEPKKIAEIKGKLNGQTSNSTSSSLLATSRDLNDKNNIFQLALERYNEVKKQCGPERLLSGSDDFTMFLWAPSGDSQSDSATNKKGGDKPITRLTGHQQIINHVVFSPDGRYIASGAYDRSIRLWDGRTGRFLTTLRGHVGKVFQLAWSADSRLLLSGSEDSTLKVWDVEKRKLAKDLPGHADAVYAVDWSQDGSRAVSGGKDRVVKMWRF